MWSLLPFVARVRLKIPLWLHHWGSIPPGTNTFYRFGRANEISAEANLLRQLSLFACERADGRNQNPAVATP
jgi:hypothetical protein